MSYRLSAQHEAELALQIVLNDATDELRPIRPTTIEWAFKILDDSGISAFLARAEMERRAAGGAGGRGAQFSTRDVCCLLILLAAEGSPLFVTNMAKVLVRRVSRATREKYGWVPRPSQSGTSSHYDLVWRAFDRLREVLDVDLIDDRRARMTTETYQETLERRQTRAEEIDLRRDRLTWFTTSLLWATWQLVPTEFRDQWAGSVSLDATPIAAFGKQRNPAVSGRVASEPDAGAYGRSGTKPYGYVKDRDTAPASWHKYLYGWEAELAIAVPTPGTDEDLPPMALAMNFHIPGVKPGIHATDALSHLTAFGAPTNYLVVDRGYSQLAEENFIARARHLNYKPVIDYKIKELGIQATHGGAIMVEGAWYCPNMPETLITATKDVREGTITEAVFLKRIATRAKYLLVPHGDPEPDGTRRFKCPACAYCPTLVCPLKQTPKIMERAAKQDPPPFPVKIKKSLDVDLTGVKGHICSQDTISIPGSVGNKHRQEFEVRYATEEWERHYRPARNQMEGFNGYLKDLGNAHPSRRRGRGFTLQFILTAFVTFGANLRSLASFLAKRRPLPVRTVDEPEPDFHGWAEATDYAAQPAIKPAPYARAWSHVLRA